MSTHAHAGPGRALALALALTIGFAAVEIAAGFLSGSLALLSDAGHMLVDSAGLVLALAATLFARRPADFARSYGYARVEVLVVPLHVLLMLGIAGYIAWEAFARLGEGVDVAATPVLVVGLLGLVLNLAVIRLLRGHSHENLNARGAVFEVMADALGSVAVIVSALVIMTTGWTPIDIIVSLLVAGFVIPRAIALLRQSIRILLESTPNHVSIAAIERDVHAVEGVRGMHDLHVWSLAPSFVALSAHVEVEDMERCGEQLAELSQLLRDRHGIGHITLQPETSEVHAAAQCCDYPDTNEPLERMHASSR